jgi:subtilisin
VRAHSISGLFAITLLSGVALAQDAVQVGGPLPVTAQPPASSPNRYIVTFAAGTSQNERANAVLFAGAQLRHNYDTTEAAAVTVPNGNVLEALRRNPRVSRVVPDFVIKSAAKGGPKPPPPTPTPITFDTRQLISTEVQRVGPPATGSDGLGIGIAVIDSGIDFNHPDLAPAANNPVNAYNATSPGSSCQDDGGHGTHVAGMIAALNNSIAIVGVAPAATLYCVKVLGSNLLGTDSDLLAGLEWVLANHSLVNPPIRVVNASLGRVLDPGETLATSVFRPVIQALYAQGVVVVVSAGNDPTIEISQTVPAGFPEVLAVASTVASSGVRACLLAGDPALGAVPADAVSGFTTDGAGVTISAPGEERTDIVSLPYIGCQGLQYGTLSTTLGTTGATRKLVPSLAEARGTSFAAPLVSGIVARVLQKLLVPLDSGATTVEGVRTWLRTNASGAGTAPVDHPWANVAFPYTFDGVREGIAQAPK